MVVGESRPRLTPHGLRVVVVVPVSVTVLLLFAQVNTGLTSDLPFGGTSPSFWCLSGRLVSSLADPERFPSSPQTR